MVIENVIDMAHLQYVHKGTVGNHAAFVDIIIERKPKT
jgi:phenylpropionate dioxygenase-like ring-hydroxylating dioxygenase large terminal subunit